MSKEPELFSEKEAAHRRDEVVRRMANTPPQPKATNPHPKKKRKLSCVARFVGSEP